MSIDKKHVRVWIQQIRDVLNTEWDPIGGCPPDEYDSYIGEISVMLRTGAPDEQIIAYLKWAETVHMGLGSVDERKFERWKRVVSALRALGSPPRIPG